MALAFAVHTKVFESWLLLLNEFLDGRDQLPYVAKSAPPDSLIHDFAEPSFYEIQPRTAGRDEVDMKSWVSLQPRCNFGVLMCRVIVYDEMQVQVGRRLRIAQLEELDPLLMTMLWLTGANARVRADSGTGRLRHATFPRTVDRSRP